MGRVYQPTYTAKDPKSGKRVTKRFKKAWYIEYTDALGKTVRRKAGLTKDAATDALRKAESEVLAEKNGLPTVRVAELPCSNVLERYLLNLKGRATARHHRAVERRIKEVLAGIRAGRMKQVTPEVVSKFLNDLENDGRSARTINCYLQAIKGMLAWAVKSRIVPFNPLDALGKRSEAIKSRKRRPLTDDESSRLLAAVLEGPYRRARRSRMNRPKKDGTYKEVPISLAKQAELAHQGRNMQMIYRLIWILAFAKTRSLPCFGRTWTWNRTP